MVSHHALTVQTASGRVFVAPGAAADLRPQRVVHPLPGAVIPPLPKIGVDGLPLRKVRGQHAPLDAPHDKVQDGVDHRAHLDGAGAAAGFGGRDERHDTLPLAVGQVRWVALVVRIPSLSQLLTRPSPPFQTVSEAHPGSPRPRESPKGSPSLLVKMRLVWNKAGLDDGGSSLLWVRNAEQQHVPHVR